jgi:hypothetical protein
MHRKFIATIAALAIAVTAFGAAPARADDRDTARILATILGAAVVGKIIYDRNKRKQRSNYERRQEQPVYKPRRNHAPRVAKKPPAERYRPAPRYTELPRHAPEPRPLPRRVDRKLLPGECFRSYETYDGRVRMFGRRCLQENYRFAHRLPKYCMTDIATNDGRRRGYEARCLRAEGYRLAHR